MSSRQREQGKEKRTKRKEEKIYLKRSGLWGIILCQQLGSLLTTELARMRLLHIKMKKMHQTPDFQSKKCERELAGHVRTIDIEIEYNSVWCKMQLKQRVK